MKKIGLLIATLALASCSKPTATNTEPAPPAPPEVVATPAPVLPAPAPLAIAAPPPSTPAPAAKVELAPEGVFYVTSLVRVGTESGLHSLPPGTGVKLVRPGVYLTSAGEIPIESWQLTNDMAVARAARDADRAAQAGTQARLIADKSAVDAVARIASTPLPLVTKSPAQIKRAELSQQSKLINVEIERINAESRNLPNRDSKTSPAAARLKQRKDQLHEELRKIAEARALIPY